MYTYWTKYGVSQVTEDRGNLHERKIHDALRIVNLLSVTVLTGDSAARDM